MIKLIKAIVKSRSVSPITALMTPTIIKYIVIAIVSFTLSIIVSGSVYIKHLHTQNKKCTQEVIRLSKDKVKLGLVNGENQLTIKTMNKTARDNSEKLRLSKIRTVKALKDLETSKEELRLNSIESDERLREAFADNIEWGKTPVPLKVCESIL